MSFSAPGWSRIVRESVSEEVANARREGMLALMSDDVDGGALRGQDQVDAGGARELRDALN